MVMGSEDPVVSPAGRFGFSTNVDFSQIWSLKQYQDRVKEEMKEEKWDEFEKSIIARLADDVVVGVKGKNVNIIVKKNFG